MKRALRLTSLAVLLVLAAVVLGALVPRPLSGGGQVDVAPRHVLVISNPIHTNIAVPIEASVLARFGFLIEEGFLASWPEARYLVFGWGSRAFYLATPTWSELRPGPLLAALTLDQSAMHVDTAGDIALPHPAVSRFDVGEAEFAALLDFIAASFERDGAAVRRIAGARYGSNDAFFEANGYFTALAGCNTWAAAALREAGLTTGWWNPLPLTLNWSLGLYNRSSSVQPGGIQP
ncbi:TIGR02117 family protein [Mesorhizobium sp. ANAO-SY3R2]|uniref:TIGR02117 family protein n=1 Tax=Mesorhizobium sp. ANAO-SY3R2 TaxID=3166644 RepID=UPI003671BFC6